MNRFTADYSSSINSAPAHDTPPRRRQVFSIQPDHASTTPLAPPPSAVFGSSRLGSGVSKLRLSKEPTSSPPVPTQQSLFRPKNPAFAQGNKSSLRQSVVSQGDELEEDEDYEDYEDEMEESDLTNHQQRPQGFFGVNAQLAKGPSLFNFSTNSTNMPQPPPRPKRSLGASKISKLPRSGRAEILPGLARDLARRSKPAAIEEPDEVILDTELLMRQLDDAQQSFQDEAEREAALSGCTVELIACWRRNVTVDRPSFESNTIGPSASSSSFSKADFLASLLLGLHHPPPSSLDESKPSSIPQILLDWLETYHVSYESMINSVLATSDSCTAHELFWDAVQILVLRGSISDVVHLFSQADFRHAATAIDDGIEGPGYTGPQLQAIQSVIQRARVILNSCPLTQDSEWDPDDADWDVFRNRVTSEMDNLAEMAAAEEDEGDDDKSFRAENFGIGKSAASLLARSARTSQGSIPWTIYQNMKILYSILLGSAEEIIAQSQDWLEAAIALTVWWDGTDDAKITDWSLSVGRASKTARDGVGALNPYLSRLRDAFLCVTDPDDKELFQLNALSPVEVGLGCVLQGQNEAAVAVLRTLSQSVASAVAEIGSTGGWLFLDRQEQATGLSSQDLLVLSYGAPTSDKLRKDDVLVSYADALFDYGEFDTQHDQQVEGWELAISVVARLDDRDLTKETVAEYLGQLPVTDQDRAEKLINLCSDLALQEEARKISERFGDHLIGTSTDYGVALLCYARSRSSTKVRQLVDLLDSYCLVQSKAYPSASTIDSTLRELVSNPRAALASIAEFDPEAAELLRFYLVGYACLRKFYTVRDGEDESSNAASKRQTNLSARKRAAANPLVAAINSAADSIYGGLYDAERQSAIQVDGLLTLLGEVTAYLSDGSVLLTSEQMYAILAAVEDLQTVNKRVYDAAEDCLQASLRNYRGGLPPSPHEMLKKSMSSGTTSNFSFSMMGSEMLARSEESMGGQSLGSAVLVDLPDKKGVRRGWDWRERFSKDQPTTGADVLRYLRVRLAHDMSMAGMDG